jgi:hypothetical protein
MVRGSASESFAGMTNRRRAAALQKTAEHRKQRLTMGVGADPKPRRSASRGERNVSSGRRRCGICCSAFERSGGNHGSAARLGARRKSVCGNSGSDLLRGNGAGAGDADGDEGGVFSGAGDDFVVDWDATVAGRGGYGLVSRAFRARGGWGARTAALSTGRTEPAVAHAAAVANGPSVRNAMPFALQRWRPSDSIIESRESCGGRERQDIIA